MLNKLLGPTSVASMLKRGLDESSRRAQGIAHRVANATTPGVGQFDAALNAAEEGAQGVDLEAEMVALADERIRYEATSRLLQKVYQQIRLSVREG